MEITSKRIRYIMHGCVGLYAQNYKDKKPRVGLNIVLLLQFARWLYSQTREIAFLEYSLLQFQGACCRFLAQISCGTG